MKNRVILCCALILCSMLFITDGALAKGVRLVDYFDIATVDNRPLSIKLLYKASTDIGYQAVINSSNSLAHNYVMADKDGVISSAPDITEQYPNIQIALAENYRMPSDSSEYSCWVYEDNKLEKWDMNKRELPVGAAIINGIHSIWVTNPHLAYSLTVLLVLLTTVIIGLYFFLNKYHVQKRNLENVKEVMEKDAQLREVKERVEYIINVAPIMYLLIANGKVVEINRQAADNLGLEIGDFISGDIMTYSAQRESILKRYAELKRSFNEIIGINFANGESHRCIVRITNVEYERNSSVNIWALDIEENEKQRDHLAASQQSLQMVLEMLPMAVRIIHRREDVPVYANKACRDLFGYENGINLSAMNTSGVHPELKDGIESVYSAEPVARDITYRNSMGDIFETRVISCDIEYMGFPASLELIEDLTREKEYQRMLLSAAEKEKEANKLKSTFLVNMSHEIRTPMNAIIGFTEIELRKGADESREVYKKINTSAKYLLNIINEILDLSKIEADKLELFEDEFELEDVINSALLVASPRLDEKDVEFILKPSFDLPRYLMGDKTRLWQILKNFLDNSAKYTNYGKIMLDVSVNKDLSDDKTIYISFVIEDTGIGMSREQLEKVFTPYQQFKNEAQQTYTGTGLGMVISKHICELMGGEVLINSSLGEGTIINIEIPFKRSLKHDNMIQLDSSALQNINVLIVDDDEITLGIIEEILGRSNAKCVFARDGEEAIEVIEEHRSRGVLFDIILLDYMLEGMDGLETACKIHAGFSNAPKLLMVTAYQMQLLGGELDKNSIDDILEKPFIPSQFIGKLCSTLGKENVEIENKAEEAITKYNDVNVLLCEDYRLNQEVARGMFEQFGVEVTVVDNGLQALDILKDNTFDMIFMDLRMPEMDGYETTHVIRADNRFDNVPIISMTADAMTEVVKNCLEIGMNDHIAKPVEFSAVNKIFQKWLPASKRLPGVRIVKLIGDKDDGASRFGGDRELYEKALVEFATLLPDWPEFHNAVTGGREETLYELHKLKGLAGNLAVNDIYNYSSKFEASLLEGNPDKRLYRKLVNASDTFRKKSEGLALELSHSVGEERTDEELIELLSKLRVALENYDPYATSKAAEALKWSCRNSMDNKLLELCELARSYEFEAALEILDTT